MIEGASAAGRPPLSLLQVEDASNALMILPPGMTLTDSARIAAGLNAEKALPSDMPIAGAMELFLTAKAHQCAAVTLDAYRQTIGHFGRMSGVSLQGATAQSVMAFLAGKKAVTRNTQWRNLAVFFNWAKGNGMIGAAPTNKDQLSKAVEPPKGILKPDEMKRLLFAAAQKCPVMIPYIALGAFAGVRPDETIRLGLRPDKVGQEWILLDGEVTKTALTRTVTVHPNLRAWLKAFPLRPFPELKRRRRTLLGWAIKAADIGWKHDCLRHSWATFYYELIRDENRVASEAGHGTAVFRTNYRAMSTPGDGKRYFGIYPKARKTGRK